jgi:hypothetical protein
MALLPNNIPLFHNSFIHNFTIGKDNNS